jgi:hypothetical protein
LYHCSLARSQVLPSLAAAGFFYTFEYHEVYCYECQYRIHGSLGSPEAHFPRSIGAARNRDDRNADCMRHGVDDDSEGDYTADAAKLPHDPSAPHYLVAANESVAGARGANSAAIQHRVK